MVSKKIMVFVATASILSGACVKSNLDNAFDPQFPLGMIVGLTINSGSDTSSSSSGGSTGTSSSLCSTGPDIQEYFSPGTYAYNVSSSASAVQILIVGAGGGGGTITPIATAGGDSSVKVTGNAAFLTATGGGAGAATSIGTGGTAGSPGGSAGTDGVASVAGTGGYIGTYGAKGPGRGGDGITFLTFIAGGGGGSGGHTTTTRTDLAGESLEIIVGAGGVGSEPENEGNPGYARLLVY